MNSNPKIISAWQGTYVRIYMYVRVPVYVYLCVHLSCFSSWVGLVHLPQVAPGPAGCNNAKQWQQRQHKAARHPHPQPEPQHEPETNAASTYLHRKSTKSQQTWPSHVYRPQTSHKLNQFVIAAKTSEKAPKCKWNLTDLKRQLDTKSPCKVPVLDNLNVATYCFKPTLLLRIRTLRFDMPTYVWAMK